MEAVMTRRKPYKPLPPDIVIGEADNPYTHAGAQRKITVAFSTRDDPLRGMLARGQIDKAQFEAGRLWQKYREQSEIGGLKAIDLTKEPVDGGGSYPEPISDVQRRAVAGLGEARVKLGAYGADLVESVLWERHSLVRAAAARKFVSKDGLTYVGKRFRECLESLARLWGFAS